MSNKVTKGCTYDSPGLYFDAQVSTYNTGFYITTKTRIDDTTMTECTTRSTPAKVISYIGTELRKLKIPEAKVEWKANVKVIKDKETGLNKTHI